MFAVGIDVSKSKSTVAILNSDGTPLVHPFIMAHTLSGMNSLVERIRSFGGPSTILMEYTGHYHYPILKKLQSEGFPVCLINPYQMKKYGDVEIHKAKTENQLIAGIVLTGGGAMMRHIQQLAEFKTGLEVRIGYPNEHLDQTEMKELSSPMFSTGIGIVIETIARMEHDDYLRQAEEARKKQIGTQNKPVETVTAPEVDETTPEPENPDAKKKKKKGIDLKKIVTSFTEFFTPDNIE